MLAHSSIVAPSFRQALPLVAIAICCATSFAQDPPSRAILRRTPSSTVAAGKQSREVAPQATVPRDVVPPSAADRDDQVVLAADTEGVNPVRIRAVEPPRDMMPSVAPKSTTPSAPATQPTANPVSPATRPAPAAVPPVATPPPSVQRLPPINSSLPPANQPARVQQRSMPAQGNTQPGPPPPVVAKRPPTAEVVIEQEPTTSQSPSAAKPDQKLVPSTPVAQSPNPSPQKPTGMSYFDPTRLMSWMRRERINEPADDAPSESGSPAAEATHATDQAVETEGSPAIASQPTQSGSSPASRTMARSSPAVSPKPNPRRPQPNQATKKSDASGKPDPISNPLKAIRSLWSGGERSPAPEEQASQPMRKPAPSPDRAPKQSLFGQLFGSRQKPAVAKEAEIRKRAEPRPQTEELADDGNITIERRPSAEAQASRATPPAIAPRAANARLGVPDLETAAEDEVADEPSSTVLR